MRPVNPYAPNEPHMHRAFREGVDAAYEANQPQPVQNAGAMCGRSSARQMIEGRIERLCQEIDGLQALVKFADAMDGTPAESALWKLVADQRV